jgi:hypothetical protein
MADIEALCAVESEGVEGVICGRAIYSGDLDFAAAQARADELNGGRLGDMPPDGFARMLCVEAAQVMTPVEVAAGQTWQGWQRLTVI